MTASSWRALAAVLAVAVPAIAASRGSSLTDRHSAGMSRAPAFDQEFNGHAGARLNGRLWNYDRGGEPQWGNHEWEYYTDRSANVSMDGHGHP